METNAAFEADVFSADCPSRQVLDRLGDKWSVLVIMLLDNNPMRFSQLQRCIGGISQKMLAQTLRTLERNGMITRTVYPEIPPHVEYKLTPLGATLCEPIGAIARWAEEHIGEVATAQAQYDSRNQPE